MSDIDDNRPTRPGAPNRSEAPPPRTETVAATETDRHVHTTTARPLSKRFATWAFVAALLVPVWFGIAALGHKFGIFDLSFAFGTMIIGLGPWLLGIVALLAIIAIVWNGLKRNRGALLLAVLALLVPIAAFIMMASTRAEAQSNPIHDVTTNPNDPPMFSPRIVEARNAEDANDMKDYRATLDYAGGRSTAELNRRLYGHLQPLVTSAPVSEAMAEVEEAMRQAGFENVEADERAGIVEGTAETFWFGFEDDVVARVRAVEDRGSVIDLRSVSRVGQSDLGKNAERVGELRAAIEQRLNQVPQTQ